MKLTHAQVGMINHILTNHLNVFSNTRLTVSDYGKIWLSHDRELERFFVAYTKEEMFDSTTFSISHVDLLKFLFDHHDETSSFVDVKYNDQKHDHPFDFKFFKSDELTGQFDRFFKDVEIKFNKPDDMFIIPAQYHSIIETLSKHGLVGFNIVNRKLRLILHKDVYLDLFDVEEEDFGVQPFFYDIPKINMFYSEISLHKKGVLMFSHKQDMFVETNFIMRGKIA